MRPQLIKWWRDVRESYWFIPALMAVSAITLSFITTAIDRAIGSQWLDDISWLHANKPAGARAVLSTVAGSMITVAGVTFSMTILSISYATGQVGPRLLNNFMRDTSNQITLGVFISTFLYCLMVLRTVTNADSVPVGGSVSELDLHSAFVPHVAIIVGLLLAIASVGVLIFFIHHIPESIHISNLVAGVGWELNRRLEQRFPSTIGSPRAENSKGETENCLPHGFYQTACKIHADGNGYIQYVDGDGLMGLATKHDLVIRLRFRAGDFVTPQSVLLLVSPKSTVDEELSEKLRLLFIRGAQRTDSQNLRFQFNQLIEVAVRALSPGVNDPYTAMLCMDWLQSALENCASRELPDADRYDDNGNLRIVAEPESFASFASLVFDQLRPYVALDRNAAIHMMEMLAKIAVTIPDNARRRTLVRYASLLRRECRRSLPDQQGLRLLMARHRSLIWLLTDADYRQHVFETGDWIGGRA